MVNKLRLGDIYVSLNWVIIGSGNDLSPVRRQAFTCTNDDLFSIEPVEINLSEIWIKYNNFHSKKISIRKCRLQNVGSNASYRRLFSAAMGRDKDARSHWRSDQLENSIGVDDGPVTVGWRQAGSGITCSAGNYIKWGTSRNDSLMSQQTAVHDFVMIY